MSVRTADIRVAVTMLRLRANAVGYFVREARTSPSPRARSAAQFHAVGLRRYSASLVEKSRA